MPVKEPALEPAGWGTAGLKVPWRPKGTGRSEARNWGQFMTPYWVSSSAAWAATFYGYILSSHCRDTCVPMPLMSSVTTSPDTCQCLEVWLAWGQEQGILVEVTFWPTPGMLWALACVSSVPCTSCCKNSEGGLLRW